jgi:hypothetical protein
MRASKPFQTFVVLAFLIGHGAAARAQSTFPLTVSDRTATAVIELPGGYAADLSLEFEDVVGLHAGALEVSARVLSPLDVLALLPRFPGGSATTIPTSFLVLLQIEPTSTSALSMAGIVTISLHTHAQPHAESHLATGSLIQPRPAARFAKSPGVSALAVTASTAPAAASRSS